MLCQDLQNHPYTITECMHSFCEFCIRIHLIKEEYTNNREAKCPLCRIIFNEQSLKENITLKDIISIAFNKRKIYHDAVEHFEEWKRKEIIIMI